MFNFFTRGVKRVFGYGNTGSTNANVTSPSSAAQADSAPVSTSIPAPVTSSHRGSSFLFNDAPAPKRARGSILKQDNNRNDPDMAVRHVTFQFPSTARNANRANGRARRRVNAHQCAQQANVEERIDLGKDTTTGFTSTIHNRSNRQPKRQQDIRRNPNKAPAVPAPRVVIENSTAEKPLPDDYSGTINGIQYYTPDYTQDHKCGHIDEHKLACGHWIKSSAPCGVTCRNADKKVEAFICPTCDTIAREAIDNKLTPEERYTLSLVIKGHSARLVVWVHKLITRHCPSITAGVHQLSRHIATGIYGRRCESSQGPVSYMPIHELARKVAQTQAFNKMAVEDPLTKHSKREYEKSSTTNKKAKHDTSLAGAKRPTIETEQKDTITSNKKFKPDTSLAGYKRATAEPNTTPRAPLTPVSIPNTPSPAKRQCVSRVNASNFSGTKRFTPPVDYEAESERAPKRVRTQQVLPTTFKGQQIIWYGNCAIIKTPNGGNRTISRDTRAQLWLLGAR
ncbi:hypothetical protein T440DRAFT_522450 [Plenodomus tracheiphilus IPT5]|uniref:Uncharacterized protein n=1 Tax=Plenodomus tracheiphilus IPT5 TaxID=1408161 RepID=A0A6A7ARN0_9PLEO|nr:hypothetical protein T440DRAFT_522450 [Plenodomus tracheiphilus IPT5]